MIGRAPKNNNADLSKKQTNKYRKKMVILQSIGIVVIKSKETRVITYTCTYSSGHLIPQVIEFRQFQEFTQVMSKNKAPFENKNDYGHGLMVKNI